ncbi:hypothetical protein ACQEU3_34945 [Spirillospora sp. CA-253888]
MPAKLRERIDHYQERVRGWQGTHLLHGRTAGPGDVMVAGNDNLALASNRRIADTTAGCLTGGADDADDALPASVSSRSPGPPPPGSGRLV